MIVLLIINQPALTIDTAYKKYTDMLERDRDQIVEFSQSNGSDNIAVFEDGETAIPCVLYKLMVVIMSLFYIHCFLKKKASRLIQILSV